MAQLMERVRQLVHTCGRIIRESSAGAAQIHEKGPADFVTDTDITVSDMLARGLVGILPGSRVITEESAEHDYDMAGDVWIIDPIDGTTNFIFGYRHSAVSVALMRGGKPVLGVVLNPYTDEMFYASQGGGAFLNGRPVSVCANRRMADTLCSFGTAPYRRALSDASFIRIRRVFDRCLDIRRSGSAALDLAYVACGRTGAFFEGILSPWDYAAGSLLILEAGGTISGFGGAALTFLAPEPVCASNGLLHAELLELLDVGGCREI